MRRSHVLLLTVPRVLSAACRSLPSAPPCVCSQVLGAPAPSCPPLDLGGVEGALAGRAPGGWENLVFEGGGVKGTAYAGALQVLDAAGGLDGVERVGGTSAGSITALLVAPRPG